ncbi:MAG: T9SS C-terminal target domain-containing protein, partial [Flavobacteriaceae bacterium]|nr:T9SS C-terminal target domain-containing protein [Flavobacteriaceae bacterium]
MKKKYIIPLLFISFLFAASTSYAQQNVRTVNSSVTQDIDGLTIYPNPVTNNKVFISSTLN